MSVFTGKDVKVFVDGKEIEASKLVRVENGFVVRTIDESEPDFKYSANSQGTDSPTETINGKVKIVCAICNNVSGINHAPLDCEECGAVGSMHCMSDDLCECAECGHCEQNWHDCTNCN